MMQRTGKRRRRPQRFGNASTVVTWALFWTANPSSAFPFHRKRSPEEKSLHHSHQDDCMHIMETIGRIQQRITTKRKPLTVFLRDNNDKQQKKLRRVRRLYNALSPTTFMDDTPTPTFLPTVSQPPSIAPAPSRGAGGRDSTTTTTTSVVHIPVISKSTKNPSSSTTQNQPLLKFAAVPVGFDVLLETDSQQDLEQMAQEAKQILQDHLTVGFRRGFADEEGVSMRSVDLNVRAFLTGEDRTRNRNRHRSRFLLQLQQQERILQRLLSLSRAITLEARGVAGFQVNRNAVDTDQFLAKVNSIIDESVEPQGLMSIFQNSTYGLSDFRVASVTNTGQPTDDDNDNNDDSKPPTLVEIIIAFVLIALMLASLGAYAYIFYRKRQKRLKRRKQFGMTGHNGGKTPSPYKVPRPHGASITPAATTVANITTSPLTTPGGGTLGGGPSTSSYTGGPPPTVGGGGVVKSSSSESSYKGLGSESEEDDADIFAKELRLAASLDRRAWDDFQQRTQQVVESDQHRHRPSVINDPVYNSQNDVYRELDAATDGIEIGYRLSDEMAPSTPGAVGGSGGGTLTITGDTVSIHSNNSFPYGDEHSTTNKPEYKPAIQFGAATAAAAEANVLKESNLNHPRRNNDYMAPAGEGSAGKAALEDLAAAERERNDGNRGWHMTTVATSELNRDAPGKQPGQRTSPRPFSFLYHAAGSSKAEPERHPSPEYPMDEENALNTSRLSSSENASEPTSAGAIRSSPMSHSWSTNPRPGSGTTNGTTGAIRGSPRGSPQNSSFNTGASASRVVSQDGNFSASPLALNSTEAVNFETASAEASEGDSSLLTADIVKEVQRLSQFVKTYERKKEHRLKREQLGGVDDADLSNSLGTSSMDYDSLMDQLSSLQNVVDPTPRASSNSSNNKSFQPNEIARKATSSTSMSNSPERSLSRQIDRLDSMQSDDSSAIETMESDDLSRRLGITPFSVQKPLAYQNPPTHVHAISHISAAYYQRPARSPSASPNEKNQQHNNNRNHPHAALSSLRHSGGAILDGSMKDGPSDEYSSSAGFGGQDPRPFGASDGANLQDPRTTVAPRKFKRSLSGNGRFDGIVDMFESSQREPLYPPNESWQYNY